MGYEDLQRQYGAALAINFALTLRGPAVISDKFTGQSRGFGFVEMSSSSEAQSAIQSLNGMQFEGRSLTVN